MRPAVATGLDLVAQGENAALVRGRRIGLLAHPASVDASLRHARHVLEAAGARIAAIFGPEHGYGGAVQDMAGVAGGQDPSTGAPVHSLYGTTPAELKPRPEWLDGLDAVVVDLQDVGSRYYTFVWTAALMLRAAASRGVTTIVLDRPNPLGGMVVEGAPQRQGYRSFVGLYDVAARHGMTIGELCWMVRDLENLDAEALEVVPMKGWKRSMLWQDTGLPWVLPSPNMPTTDTVQVYPGGCLLEGTNLSEGRGTTRPFEIWGAPFLSGELFARAVEIEGAVLRPLSFVPTFNKHAGQTCGGVQVHVTDPQRFRPFSAYIRMLCAAASASGGAFEWRAEPYEFVEAEDRPAIDLLTGGPEVRRVVRGDGDLGELLERDAAGAAAFADQRKPHFLYQQKRRSSFIGRQPG